MLCAVCMRVSQPMSRRQDRCGVATTRTRAARSPSSACITRAMCAASSEPITGTVDRDRGNGRERCASSASPTPLIRLRRDAALDPGAHGCMVR